ncbi:MAG TPA: dephospho-CoA kinase [Bacteroidales bacterium]|jgi:dephospho-CoA kinase|nr:dephospho-CoA kinase [Bacteroidales bacterium]HOB26864.1 dephospho-CoA kinase [Bacteroidales bacterium]HPU46578.1 dephospho-CoA kinase [Bacteroidales bacterium]HPZ35992.1 dephospho-CoA kinase [Bacteroidales bacterium]HQD34282.1 dephospho-CoA kinase [Bacteroidales bacterium]
MNKCIIGITGNIGSGKSTFARWFSDLDCCVIDLDSTAKTLYFHDIFRQNVIDILGIDPLDGDKLKTTEISDIIYSHDDKFNKLTQLFSQFLPSIINKTINTCNKNYIIIDAALLFEYELDKICDITICIYAPLDVRYERIKTSRNNIFDYDRFIQIDSHQLPNDFKCEKADFCVKNISDIEHLRNEFLKISKNIIK